MTERIAGANHRAGQYARLRGIMRMVRFVPQRLNQPKSDARVRYREISEKFSAQGSQKIAHRIACPD
jgi:hypothetical protein